MKHLVLLASLALVGAGCAGLPIPKEKLTDPGALLFNGYADVKVDCFRCHNGDATGSGSGPALGSRVRRMSAGRIGKVIREGDFPMPKYGPEVLSEEQLTQVVTWLKATFP